MVFNTEEINLTKIQTLTVDSLESVKTFSSMENNLKGFLKSSLETEKKMEQE
jgi:hypothetical protein